ncbi:hypothetical protein D5S17_23395 [Pseudonocardiaceae bacterium YIM PH 21723]|nr:hypothetical protein D5S17_23395 [Pseudonocardiaceae bacterium YIM PH 21723]
MVMDDIMDDIQLTALALVRQQCESADDSPAAIEDSVRIYTEFRARYAGTEDDGLTEELLVVRLGKMAAQFLQWHCEQQGFDVTDMLDRFTLTSHPDLRDAT